MAAWNFEPEAGNGGKQLVGVAGVWNAVGQWVIRGLLEKGYRVRCALRSNPEQAAELMGIREAEENLELSVADLLDFGDLVRAFSGCSAVFFTTPSSDSLNGLQDYPAEIIESEVRSALNVVEACANTSSVKRLILTSCASTIVFDSHHCKSGAKVIDERCWSNLDYCRENKLWGAVSKTLAEKAAWALARDRGVNLVVINPATVVGPSATSTQVSMICHLKEGKHSAVMAYAHVDDVADVHIRALESVEASGRFLVFHRLLSNVESAEIQKSYTNSSRLAELWTSLSFSNQKLQRLAGH